MVGGVGGNMVLVDEVYDEIEKRLDECENEAEVSQLVDDQIKHGIYSQTGKWLLIKKEVQVNIGTVRGIFRGRIDSNIGSLVGEYKKPGLLKSKKEQGKARTQIEKYLGGLDSSKPLLGYITDGTYCEIFRYQNRKVIATEHKGRLDGRALELILDAAQDTYYELSSTNLVRALCSQKQGELAKNLSRNLFAVLAQKKNDKNIRSDFIDPWMALFRLSHDDKNTYQKDTQDMNFQLAEFMDCEFEDPIDQHLALLCIQTAFAATIKLTAYRVLMQKQRREMDFHGISNYKLKDFYVKLREIDSGQEFPNFPNLMEEDTFTWYTNEEFKDKDIAESLRAIIVELARFQPVIIQVGEESRINDLFHKFYMKLMPSKVRHSLGEYFTPGWLAEHVIESGMQQLNVSVGRNWKALDPTCGSGTFLQAIVTRIMNQDHLKKKPELIRREVLNRVHGFDLNPISVLAARVNLYLALESLSNDPLKGCEIPVYLLDSAVLRETKNIKEAEYTVLTHSYLDEHDQILTRKVLIKKSIAADSKAIQDLQTRMRAAISLGNKNQLEKVDQDLSGTGEEGIGKYIAKMLIESKAKAKLTLTILLNQARAHNLEPQNLIVGNLPWVDWRNLPPGYREHVKQLCIDQHLFSGDGRTGGNNLNICGLLSNVAGKNWLHDNGSIAVLMPSNLMFQTSYEGWRNLKIDDDQSMYVQKIVSWQRAANPFVGIGQKFNTYLFTKKEVDYTDGVPFIEMIKKKRTRSWKWRYENGEGEKWTEVEQDFEEEELLAGRVDERSTRFWVARNRTELTRFEKMAGGSEYRSREGLELYPQDLLLWEVTEQANSDGLITVKNFQGDRSKIKRSPFIRQIEAQFVHPVVRGPNVKPFELVDLKYVSALPYENRQRAPIPREELLRMAPNLANFYGDNMELLDLGTDTTMRTVGTKNATEPYAIGRVGTYTYGENFVVFRDNTKLVACAVTGAQNTWWGGKRPYICQNHAPYISQTIDGIDITADEALYLAAILNAPIVVRFVESSNDGRSFEVRMLETLRVDRYDSSNKHHKRLVRLSKAAHADPSEESLARIEPKLDAAYLASCDQRDVD